MTLTEKPTRQLRRALARQSPTVFTQRLTEEITAKGAARVAAATAAAAVTQGQLTDAPNSAAWRTKLERHLQTIQQHPEQNLGHIEEAVAAAATEPLRLLTQRAPLAKTSTPRLANASSASLP